MSGQLMDARALFDIPNADHAIQRTGDNVFPIELNERQSSSRTLQAKGTYDKGIDSIGVSF